LPCGAQAQTQVSVMECSKHFGSTADTRPHHAHLGIQVIQLSPCRQQRLADGSHALLQAPPLLGAGASAGSCHNGLVCGAGGQGQRLLAVAVKRSGARPGRRLGRGRPGQERVRGLDQRTGEAERA
jgi:hypothetical protein